MAVSGDKAIRGKIPAYGQQAVFIGIFYQWEIGLSGQIRNYIL
jgi:hypothetical protein